MITIDVVGLDVPNNPFGDMDVNDIPIEIVDNFNDESDLAFTQIQHCPSVFSDLFLMQTM